MLDDEDVRRIMQAVRAVFVAEQSVTGEVSDRWLGGQLKGYEKVKPQQLFRHFVETGGLVEVGPDRIVVTLDRRSHNPILREAALDRALTPVPWLRQLPVVFCYS